MFDSDHFRYMEITVKECRNETKRGIKLSDKIIKLISPIVCQKKLLTVN